MTTSDSYSEQLISRVRQAENLHGAFGTAVFSQVLVDMIQYQEHVNRLILHGIRRLADKLEVQP